MAVVQEVGWSWLGEQEMEKITASETDRLGQLANPPWPVCRSAGEPTRESRLASEWDGILGSRPTANVNYGTYLTPGNLAGGRCGIEASAQHPPLTEAANMEAQPRPLPLSSNFHAFAVSLCDCCWDTRDPGLTTSHLMSAADLPGWVASISAAYHRQHTYRIRGSALSQQRAFVIRSYTDSYLALPMAFGPGLDEQAQWRSQPTPSLSLGRLQSVLAKSLV